MIQFEHTLFALPFAFMGAVLAAQGIPGADQIFWILIAMVGARSAAMTFNRLVDQPFDALNPRTSARPLVTGELDRRFACLFLFASCVLYFLAAGMLNRLALLLSPLVLAILLLYSYSKRFTWGTHFWLGLCLGCAPLGAWIAVQGSFHPAPVLLGVAVLCWGAGFDIIYACQDIDFDRRVGLRSLPLRWGAGPALLLSRLLHAAMVGLLWIVGWSLQRGSIFDLGVAVTAGFLVYEHTLVAPDDFSRVNRAFFTVNGLLSVFLLLITLLDVLIPT